jgi:hypothetical protein
MHVRITLEDGTALEDPPGGNWVLSTTSNGGVVYYDHRHESVRGADDSKITGINYASGGKLCCTN